MTKISWSRATKCLCSLSTASSRSSQHQQSQVRDRRGCLRHQLQCAQHACRSSRSYRTYVQHADSVILDAQDWMASQHKVNAVEKPQRVIVLNWMQDIEPLLADFAEFSPAGSEVVFVQEQRHKNLPHRVGSVRFKQVRRCTQSSVVTVCATMLTQQGVSLPGQGHTVC